MTLWALEDRKGEAEQRRRDRQMEDSRSVEVVAHREKSMLQQSAKLVPLGGRCPANHLLAPSRVAEVILSRPPPPARGPSLRLSLFRASCWPLHARANRSFALIGKAITPMIVVCVRACFDRCATRHHDGRTAAEW